MMDFDGQSRGHELKEGKTEDEDPVVSEIPVYLNHLQDPPFLCGEIHVLLNSLRHHSRPYGDQGQLSSVDVDDDSGRVRINYILNTRSDTYDASATHAMKTHSMIARPVPKDASNSSYCIGILSDGVLNLVPVTAVCNVRPSFDHIDTEAASRKTHVASNDDAPNRPLTGKALHYQQLVKSIRNDKSNWRRFDHYDFDSVEAADLFHEHVLVQPTKMETGNGLSEERRKIKELKCRELHFRCDQDQYLYKLSSGMWGAGADSPEKSGKEMVPGQGSLQELSRLDFSRQVETIMKRFQVIKFGDIMNALPANTRARYSEADVLAQLDQCAFCIQGNWVVLSHLSPHRTQLWDTRDAMLILLHAGREVSVQVLSNMGGLSKEEIEEVIRAVCSLDIITNSWKLKLRPDTVFISQHPHIIKRHESVAQSMINRLKAKKAQGKLSSTSSPEANSSSSISHDELQAMSEITKMKLIDSGSLTTDEIRQALQASTRDHFISEATALEVLRIIEAIPVRERWAIPSRGSGAGEVIDTLRLVLIGLYKDRDALTKAEILHAFNNALGRACDLSDHDLRKLIKEFASNDKGYWVFNGAMIAERRKIKDEDKDEDIMM
jgi:hypothetical protein